MFIIRKLKKLPIFDLFLALSDGWQGWTRVSWFKNYLKVLDGRKLSLLEKMEAIETLSKQNANH